MHRTHSSLKQLKRLGELEGEFDVRDTATLVSACNKTVENSDERNAFLHWLENYVPCFDGLTISECCREAMDFGQLANIMPKGTREKELLKEVFSSLCNKIRQNDYGEEKLIQSLSYFLLSADCTAFENNSQPLTRLARDLIAKLGPQETFSKSTYPTHSFSLLALHHLCAVIHEVAPAEINHDNQNGLYQQMNQCLQSIINSQSYYPFCYQAKLTRQSLTSMDFSHRASTQEARYRILCAVKGTAYLYQALKGCLTANINLDDLERGVQQWSEACTSFGIEQKPWYDSVQMLINSRMVAQNDPKKFQLFRECLAMVYGIQKKTRIKDDLVILRFVMISQVTLMAIDVPSSDTKKWAVQELVHFGFCYAQEKGWAQDPVILETLLDAVLEVHLKCEFGLLTRPALETMTCFHNKTAVQTETIQNWLNGMSLEERIEAVSKAEDKRDDSSLFKRIKKELSLDASIVTRSATQNKLKEHYQQQSEVPSLFDGEPSRHVDTLKHSLMFYEKVFTNTRQVQVVKKHIALKDLFKNRQLSPGSFAERVTRVLLFGNPGTGKTTVAKQIAYKWSIGEWDSLFDTLYMLEIRELHSDRYDDLSTRTRMNLQTAITNVCFPGENDDAYDTIKLQVEEELKKESTLVVFDGLDEGGEMSKKLINSTKSLPCRVLILSRPQNLQDEAKSADVEVECMGLSDKQLTDFIQSGSSSTDLVKYLRSHPGVWEISHVPVVANILSFLYTSRKEDIVSEDSGLNLFVLYWKMSLQTWTRYVDKTRCNTERDQIFAALEAIAFRALEDGQILIDQQLVEEHSQNRSVKDVLKGCGFLLLKKEGIFYQFPHLTFQEFFAGQFMAHSLMGSDDGRNQDAIKFLAENKYCANFRQVFCFMFQAICVKRRLKGYSDLMSHVNARPIAVCGQQHLLLSLELLEASLSAFKRRECDKILSSTNLLDKAITWIRCWRCDNGAYSYNLYMYGQNPMMSAPFMAPTVDPTDELSRMLVQVAKVARYNTTQREKLIELLKTDAIHGDGSKSALCIVPVMRIMLEEQDDLLELYWTLWDSKHPDTRSVAISRLSDIAILLPNASGQIFEKYKNKFRDEHLLVNIALLEQGPRLAEIMPDRWQNILSIIKKKCPDYRYDIKVAAAAQFARLIELVPQSRSKAIEAVRNCFVSWDRPKQSIASSCLRIINALPEKAKEIVELLWPLCQDSQSHVQFTAKDQVVQIMQSMGERTNPAWNALLSLSDSDPESSRSSLVRLVAFAYRLKDETIEDVTRLLSRLSQSDAYILRSCASAGILDSIGTKTRKEMRLQSLYFIGFIGSKLQDAEDVEELMSRIWHNNTAESEIAMVTVKLMSIDPSDTIRRRAARALYKLAINCAELGEDIFNTLETLTEDDDQSIKREACVQMFCVLETMSHRAEKTVNRCRGLIQLLNCTNYVQLREFMSLDALLKAHLKCGSDFLIFFISWKFFYIPVTFIETGSNGRPQLIVETTSINKTHYDFQTAEEAHTFMSAVNDCIELVFPEVSSFVSDLDLQKTQRSENPFFTNLREQLTKPIKWKIR